MECVCSCQCCCKHEDIIAELSTTVFLKGWHVTKKVWICAGWTQSEVQQRYSAAHCKDQTNKSLVMKEILRKQERQLMCCYVMLCSTSVIDTTAFLHLLELSC